MAKKKVLIAVIAVAMICVVSIAGTLAYLTAKSNDGTGITNTFVAAGQGKIYTGVFDVVETPVVQKEDGTYEKNSSASQTGSGIEYSVLPGSVLPKDATVKVTGKTEVPVYMYVEVIDEITATGIYTWSMDTDNWKLVDGVKGLNGGAVYVYVKNGSPVLLKKTDKESDFSINIIKDSKVTVNSSATESTISAASGKALKFFAYMGQATTGADAKTVFTDCEFVKKN